MVGRIPRDVWIGLAMLGVAIAYGRVAAGIPISPLDGIVNASVMPTALAWTLGVLAVLLIVRAVSVQVMMASATRRQAPAAPEPAEAAPEADRGALQTHLRALGMAGLALAYLVALPRLGYVPSVFLLVAAVGLYTGARPGLQLLAVAAGAAVTYYVVFVRLLGIPLPPGFWPSLLG